MIINHLLDQKFKMIESKMKKMKSFIFLIKKFNLIHRILGTKKRIIKKKQIKKLIREIIRSKQIKKIIRGKIKKRKQIKKIIRKTIKKLMKIPFYK